MVDQLYFCLPLCCVHACMRQHHVCSAVCAWRAWCTSDMMQATFLCVHASPVYTVMRVICGWGSGFGCTCMVHIVLLWNNDCMEQCGWCVMAVHGSAQLVAPCDGLALLGRVQHLASRIRGDSGCTQHAVLAVVMQRSVVPSPWAACVSSMSCVVMRRVVRSIMVWVSSKTELFVLLSSAAASVP
jgi:hypothetical protein